jgi:hypothetical protein
VTCGRCGQEHIATAGHAAGVGRPCIGHTNGEDGNGPFGPCRKQAMRGQDICASHGGKSPQALKAAAERLRREEAENYLRKLGELVITDVDPGEQLLELIAITAAEVRWFRSRVYDIDAADLVWGKTKHATGGQNKGDTYEASKNAWLALYHERADKLAALCAEAIKIGLKEREVRLAEQQADLIVKLLEGVLGDLGHDLADPNTAAVVSRHLRVVGGS